VLDQLTLSAGSALPPLQAKPWVLTEVGSGTLGLTLEGEELPFRWQSGAERKFQRGQALPALRPDTQTTFRNVGDDPLVLYRLSLMPETSATSSPVSVATPPASELVLPPDVEAYGATHAEWAERFAQWNYSFPFDDHPLNDPNPLACGAGQQGPVFFLGSVALPGDELIMERTCTIPADRALFVSVVFLGCSTLEPAFCGTTEADLRATATQWVDQTTSVEVSLDGVAIPDLEQYRVAAGPFSLIVPEGSPGTDAGVGTAFSDGYSLLMPPLSPGEHTLRTIYINANNVTPHDVTYHLHIVP
jgi:hypothetical protein